MASWRAQSHPKGFSVLTVLLWEGNDLSWEHNE